MYNMMTKSELSKHIKEEIRKILREDMASKLYKIEGLLITNPKDKTQRQILSDIRAITGVTTIDAKDYIPNLPTPGYDYDILTVKVDPHPYIKGEDGKFDENIINKIIEEINKIRGVVKFKVTNPELKNIGI